MSTASELRIYQIMVENAMVRALDTGFPELFENEGPGHARVVLDTMLAHAQLSLDVVSATMDRLVWSSTRLRRFLDKFPKARVRILLTESFNPLPENSALNGLERSENVKILRCPIRLDTHFAIVDSQHVRMEHDPETRGAYITFGDPKQAGSATLRMFEKLWSLALSESSNRATVMASVSA